MGDKERLKQMSKVVIKICGITTAENALMCAEAGADIIGLNFYPRSPRCVEPNRARSIIETLEGELGTRRPLVIGLFVNAEPGEIVRHIDMLGLDAVQLSGNEPPEAQAALNRRGIKAIRPRSVEEATDMAFAFKLFTPEDGRLPSLIIDAYHPELYGGTGQQASVDIALAARNAVPRLLLAGGLTPENVAEQIALIRPWGVDVASGVEAGQPGIKDRGRVEAFVRAVQSTVC
jgi:phosphoribosylanthranilate isomerase